MQLLSASAGHWTGNGTGVTVILPPPGTVGSGEVRGGAPATREFALLEPGRLVDRVDAVVLSGGSAFGLSAADGLMTLLRERGLGFPTPAGPVPIVIGMSIFDDSVRAVPTLGAHGAGEHGSEAHGIEAHGAEAHGSEAHGAGEHGSEAHGAEEHGSEAHGIEAQSGPPDARAGRAAALAAWRGDPFESGAVGAGAGASTGKWRGRRDPGGVGWATRTAGPATVIAVAVVNAWGDVLGPDGRPLVHATAAAGTPAVDSETPWTPASGFEVPGATARGIEVPEAPAAGFGMQNTTVAVLLTDARLSKNDCHLLAQSGHTGFARAIHPAHSRFDGDAVVALATGEVTEPVSLELIRAVAAEVMAEAIRAGVDR